jgi:GNAT superfamily N-acetyltransferase
VEPKARQIALLHVQALDQSFLSTLGVPFLTLLYDAMIEDPDTVILCEFEESQLVGFVSGGLGLKGIYMGLFKKPLSLFWSLRGVVFSFRRLRGVVEILIFSITSREKREPAEMVILPSAELYTIAVNGRARGTGLASRLYRSLGDAFLGRGIERYKILVGDQLVVAHGFYKKMGAVPVLTQRLHRGSSSTIYIQTVCQ